MGCRSFRGGQGLATSRSGFGTSRDWEFRVRKLQGCLRMESGRWKEGGGIRERGRPSGRVERLGRCG